MKLLTTAIVGTAIALAVASVDATAQTKIRIGWNQVPGHQMTAVAAGQVDIAAMSPVAFAQTVQKAGLDTVIDPNYIVLSVIQAARKQVEGKSPAIRTVIRPDAPAG